MTFVLESALDMIAEQLNLDPVDLRLKNGIGPNETSVQGWKIHSSMECFGFCKWDLLLSIKNESGNYES